MRSSSRAVTVCDVNSLQNLSMAMVCQLAAATNPAYCRTRDECWSLFQRIGTFEMP